MKLRINPKKSLAHLRHLLTIAKPVVILFGSASSGKSYFMMFASVVWCMQGRNIIIARKELNQVRRSVWLEVTKAISRLGLDRFFEIQLSQYTIKSKISNGAIVFTGVDDENKLKSITPPVATAFDTVILEEADAFTEEDYDQLRLRCRGYTPFPKRAFLIFNPVSKARMKWVWDRYFEPNGWDDEVDDVFENDEVYIQRCNYGGNTYLTDDDIEKFNALKRDNPRKFRVFGLGRFGASGKTVFDVKKYYKSDFNIVDIMSQGYQLRIGIDFGFVHASAMTISVWDRKNKTIWVIGVLSMKEKNRDKFAVAVKDKLEKFGYPKQQLIYCDYAEPAGVDTLQCNGVLGARMCAPKNVANQIDFLQSQKIIIHESCVDLYHEMESLNYKKVNGVYTEDLDDSFGDDLVASLRYAYSFDARIGGDLVVAEQVDLGS